MRLREPFNAISHLIGAIGIGIGLISLIIGRIHDLTAVLCFLMYGLMSGFLFVSSTIYHWTYTVSPRLQKMDHVAIYLMIAGTYTPVCLLGLKGNLGIGVLILEWILAAIGVVATLTMTKPPTWLRLVLYLSMGWMVLPFIGTLNQTLPPAAMGWMVAGGLAYTFGTIVYASKRPKMWPGVFSFHELWHLFVMAGALCHFMVMRYL